MTALENLVELDMLLSSKLTPFELRGNLIKREISEDLDFEKDKLGHLDEFLTNLS